MIIQLNGSFKSYDQGNTYFGSIVGDKVKLQRNFRYNGKENIEHVALLNSSVPLYMKNRYIERESNYTYFQAARLLLSN
jgi:hypothetical protein